MKAWFFAGSLLPLAVLAASQFQAIESPPQFPFMAATIWFLGLLFSHRICIESGNAARFVLFIKCRKRRKAWQAQL